MEGLNNLSLYVNLIRKYMEFIGGVNFRIENFVNETPVKITISEKDENGDVVTTYVLYGSTDADIFSLTDETGKDIIQKYQKEKKLSDKEKELQMFEFTKIIKEYKEEYI